MVGTYLRRDGPSSGLVWTPGPLLPSTRCIHLRFSPGAAPLATTNLPNAEVNGTLRLRAESLPAAVRCQVEFAGMNAAGVTSAGVDSGIIISTSHGLNAG